MGVTPAAKTPLEKESYEDIFDVIGSFGPWQRNVFLILIVINVAGEFHSFGITFLAPNIDFWCVSPSGFNDSSNYSPDINVSHETTSTENITGWKEKNQCEMRVPVSVMNTSISLVNETYSETVQCENWEYDTSVYSETIVSEWDLVCSRKWLISLAKSVYMMGFLLSVFFFGQLSDCIGRLPTCIITYLITTVCMVMSIWSTSYLMFVVLRFLQAFGRTGLSTTGYVLMMELVGSRHQAAVGMACAFIASFGIILLPGIAYFVRHWFWLQIVLSIPMFPVIFFYRYIPESPRWLLTQGKRLQLESLLIKAAARNGKEKCRITELVVLNRPEKTGKGPTTKTILDLLKTPTLRHREFNMIYI